MAGQPLSVMRTGMVTSVGLTAPASCAAIRAGLANPVESRFADAAGEWITTHVVPWESALRGRRRLVALVRRAVEECLEGLTPSDCTEIPLLLCVAESHRPGRIEGLDDLLFTELETSLGALFSTSSAIIARGRVGVAVALLYARKLVYESGVPRVLIAGTGTNLHPWSLYQVPYFARRYRTIGFLVLFGVGSTAAMAAIHSAGPLLATAIGLASLVGPRLDAAHRNRTVAGTGSSVTTQACTLVSLPTHCETASGSRPIGEQWTCGDGCNLCECVSGGAVVASLRACDGPQRDVPPPPEPGATPHPADDTTAGAVSQQPSGARARRQARGKEAAKRSGIARRGDPGEAPPGIP